MASSVGGESSRSSDTFNSTDPSKWKYDVFLSFAGKDTRLNFTGHLYEAFIRSGIKTFRDDVDLPKGEDINYLFQAIEDSLCAVLVISQNYAKSTWCLDELQKILESQNILGQRIFPVFYNVNPADVRYQRESFGEALAELEQKFKENATKVQNWRTALAKIGNLSGWVTGGKYEADLIKNIVGVTWTYLISKLPSYDDNLVGINSRVADMMSFLEIGLDDTRFVGIWGMGGIGKTTLARVVYEKLSYKFEICCFLANVRETLLQKDGLVSLQKRLLSHLKIPNMEIFDDHEGMKMIINFLHNKKVLLVLDDLDDVSQLKNLAESPKWFGKGSRIIVTTKNSHLLTSAGIEQRIYEMKVMKKDDALQLFSKKAFKNDDPKENYLKLSEYVVDYVGCLPLALQVLGSFLRGRTKDEWKDALDRLKKIPDKKILQVLQISYDGLNEEEQRIFLDVACFFKHWRKKEVIQILKSCDLHPTIGIKVLIEKSLLVETEDCRLEMHNLLEELGRHIVLQESHNNVGKRSRLWEPKDIKKVLENNMGSEEIQAIVLSIKYVVIPSIIEVHPEAFSNMSNIILLILDITGSWNTPDDVSVQWISFPFRALPVPLDERTVMHSSDIKQLWNGKPLMDKLKFISLRGPHNFVETPDFSRIPFLEQLRISRCPSLVEVHSSLGKLKKLSHVCLDYCQNLEILPTKLETNSLIMLRLYGSCKVSVLPEFGERMKNFVHLDVGYTAVATLPESLGHLTGLRYLNLTFCQVSNLVKVLKNRITREISGLNVTWLTELYLSSCRLNDISVPDDFDNLSSLIALDLSDNDFVNLPIGCFSRLSQLIFLSLRYCHKLKSLPRLPPHLIRLEVFNCNSMEPLSDRQSWNLVASLNHECRGQTKYVISDEEYNYEMFDLEPKPDESKCLLPLRDFCAIIPKCEIPSWFPNKEYLGLDYGRREYEIKVNIPLSLRDSEWSGLVVCFSIPWNCRFSVFSWSTKAAEDDDCICKEWGHAAENNLICNTDYLCIMVLELNEETCWQHLRPPNNTLHIKFVGSFTRLLRGCGWRVICKKEIQKWRNDNDFSQLTQSQLASPHDEINLPSRVFNRFISTVSCDTKFSYEWLYD